MSIVEFMGMPVSEVLGELRRQRRSGMLEIESTYRKLLISVHQGKITMVQSDRPADRLGMQLMHQGDIGMVDLHRALVEQHQQRLMAIASDLQTSRLGEILVDREALTLGELEIAVQRHIRKLVAGIDKDVLLDITFHESNGVRLKEGHLVGKTRL